MRADESDSRHPGTLWVRNLDWPVPENASPRVPATFRCIGAEDIQLLAPVMQLDNPATIEQRLTAGKRCYVAQVKDALAAYGWVSWNEEDIGEMGLRLQLMPGEAYIWDCATVADQRGQHLYTALLSHTLFHLKGEGVRSPLPGPTRQTFADCL